ncbi:MAG: helix-turn-helix transcriptional regulator [Gammaproteobacteria bacterium]|nr:helix-turn-helix transcriptional regulator [Gammaproteobacteria bacterium]
MVEYVLKGYSSEAIGKMLSISPGTVRIHRKNIYAKLGINSRGRPVLPFHQGAGLIGDGVRRRHNPLDDRCRCKARVRLR